MLQYGYRTLAVGFRESDGIVGRGVLGDPGQYGAFREVQIPYVLIEILAGCGLYAVGTGTQIDGVQVILKDHGFIADLFLDLDGQVLFLEFSGKLLQKRGFLGPVGKYIVFQQLLGDGTGTLRKFPGGKSLDAGTQYTLHIDTVVLVKTLVLDGYHGILKVLRDLADGYGKPVRVRRRQLAQLVSLVVIQEGGIAKRHDIDAVYIRRVVDDAPEASDTQADRHDHDSDQSKKQDAEKGDMCLFSQHGGPGDQRFPFFRSRPFTEFHSDPPYYLIC